MKKCLLSAMAGALSTILILMAAVRISEKPSPKEYSHIDYVSSITHEACFVCSNARPVWTPLTTYGLQPSPQLNLQSSALQTVQYNLC